MEIDWKVWHETLYHASDEDERKNKDWPAISETKEVTEQRLKFLLEEESPSSRQQLFTDQIDAATCASKADGCDELVLVEDAEPVNVNLIDRVARFFGRR